MTEGTGGLSGGLQGTVHTPLGNVKKEYLLIGGGVFALFFIVFYRQRKARDAAAATAAAGANTGIDPATGYPYGSAEDAAALANQGAYINPTQPFAPGGGGSGGGYPTPGSGPGSFTNNAQWAQYAEDYLYNHGQLSDIAPLSAAIGKYLAGRPTSPDDQSLVNQAIAIAGYPPVSAPDGRPPGFNTAPPGNSQPPPGGGGGGGVTLPPKPGGLSLVSGSFVSRPGDYYIDVSWGAVSGATSYHLLESSPYGHTDHGNIGNVTRYRVGNLAAPDTDHRISVAAVNSAGQGPFVDGTVHTKGHFVGPRPPAQPF